MTLSLKDNQPFCIFVSRYLYILSLFLSCCVSTWSYERVYVYTRVCHTRVLSSMVGCTCYGLYIYLYLGACTFLLSLSLSCCVNTCAYVRVYVYTLVWHTRFCYWGLYTRIYLLEASLPSKHFDLHQLQSFQIDTCQHLRCHRMASSRSSRI